MTTTTDPDDRRDDVDHDDDMTTFLLRHLRIPELPLGVPEDDHDATMTTTTFPQSTLWKGRSWESLPCRTRRHSSSGGGQSFLSVAPHREE
eukprot:3005642-Heterocapsa_arctica.AAC.1